MNPQDPPPKYFVDQQGVLVVDKDWVEKKSDIVGYCKDYYLPEDIGELLFLEVEGANWRLEGRKIVLAEKPTQYVRDAITVHYRPRKES